MPFNSYEFIFAFLPATLGGFWLLAKFMGRTAALGWLILASVGFYAYASLESLATIAPSILLDYLIAGALLRTKASKERLRSVVFSVGVVANVLFLSYFKYKNFFLDTANTVFSTHFELAELILPLGISFLTFQKIAFLADVRSGQVKSVPFLDYLLFTLFFPRTVAGPIVHYNEVMPQLTETTPRNFSTNVAVGVCLFSIGLFKKSVVADGVAQFVAPVFDAAPPGEPPTLLTTWSGVLSYTFQLYFDFSGYSDMALGVARMFGVRLPMNFNSPLKASSLVEFWNRWHITLTRLLTAYVYTPIVLSLTRARIAKEKPVLRGTRSRFSAIAILVAVPTLITMTISGLWHGAGWQFIVWGVLHGIYLTINQSWRIVRPRFWPDEVSYERVMKPVGFVLTFSAVVTALVFFRATSVPSALSILAGMLGLNGILPYDMQLLHNFGVTLPWSMLADFVPVTSFIWIAILWLAATRLPNSLEVLRPLQPALDFPEDLEEAPALGASSRFIERSAGAKDNFVMAKVRHAWTVAREIDRSGLSLDRVTATIVGLLWVLGVSALNRGGAFLYWKF